MITASLDPDMSLAGWISALCLLAGAVFGCLWLFPSASEHASLSPASEGVRLSQVSPNDTDTATDIDIIAVHGLDTKSPDTWTWRSQNKKWTWRSPNKKAEHPEDGVNWLQHQDMLPATAGGARIFTCDWPADLLQPSSLVQKTIYEYALLLLEGINRRPPATNNIKGEDRPLFFIASCLGGIILIKALVIANNKQGDYYNIRKATRGIVFLATPFRGTSFQDVADWAQPGLKALAFIRGRQASTLLESVKGPIFEELVRDFTQLSQDKDHPCKVFNFYEHRKTSLPSKVFPWLPACLRQDKQLVDQSSATLDIVPHPLSLQRTHRLMNKFKSTKCPDYKIVSKKIEDMLQWIREDSPLKKADNWIRNKYCNKGKLRIIRLSGDELPMDSCYVNLAIVEQHRGATNLAEQDSEEDSEEDSEDEHAVAKRFPFSIHARLKTETPGQLLQVELPTIFNQRQQGGRTVNPRRILIRGSAGVGKTTLCKKIVYDFLYGKWVGLFDRVLWLRLRTLKNHLQAIYNLESLFYYEYFYDASDGSNFARELRCAAEKGRTLFILDGLDEVSDLLDRDDGMSEFLESLLNQPNVIITSRPYARLSAALTPFDLELETIGFYPDQVDEYLRKTFSGAQKANEIQSFLKNHQLMQGLVRIPVQLDALCFIWDKGFKPAISLETMTDVYQEIELNLWKKDILLLKKKYDGEPVKYRAIKIASQRETKALAKDEISFLEGLAFTGLHNDMIEFDQEHLHNACDCFTEGLLLLGEILPCLSFLRTSDPSSKITSDPSSKIRNQTYHFLHLTYQEYFAAHYFVRYWLERPLEALKLASHGAGRTPQDVGLTPIEYLQKHKYTARYNIMWRFVAGLLDTEGNAKRFFDEIGKEPLDILGLSHQRLIIHCLSEVHAQSQPDFAPLRIKLEKRLMEWLLFECKHREESSLAREMEIPPPVLCQALQKGGESRTKLMESLKKRPSIPACVADLLASWLKTHARTSKIGILLVLSQTSILSDNVLTQVAALVGDNDRHVRLVAINTIAAQRQLSNEVLIQIAVRLDDSDSNVRRAAIKALTTRKQEQLSDEVLIQVVARLNDRDSDVREAAIEALAAREQLPDEVLRRVVARLDDNDQHVRRAAIKALAAWEQLPNEVLRRVVERLDDSDWSVRQTAIEALAAWEQLPDEVFRQVVERLNDNDRHVQRAAIEALAAREQLPNEVFRQVVERLDNSNSDVRRAAIKALTTQKQEQLSDEVLIQVVARLNDNDRHVQRAVIEALAAREQLSDEVLIQVVARLNDRDSDVREVAIEALAAREQLPDEVLRRVVERLDDSNWPVQQAAIKALAAWEQLPDEVFRQVVERLDNSNSDVRRAAIKALTTRKQEQLPNEVFRQVVAWLDDSDSDVRRAAIKALTTRKQEQLSDEVLIQVVARLNDNDRHVRRAAIEALAAREQLSNEVLIQVVARLDDNDWHVQRAAIKVLVAREQLPNKVLGRVVERLDDSDWSVRQTAIEALAAWEQLPDEVFRQVVERLDNSNSDVRRAAIKALITRKQEQLPDEVFRKVVARLDDSDSGIWRAAIKALTTRKQEQLSDKVLIQVVARLDDNDRHVRRAAIEVLIARKQLPDEVLRQVVERLNDRDSDVQEAAIEALAAREQLSDEVLIQVVARLDDRDSDVRRAVIKALTRREHLSNEVLREVVKRLEHSDSVDQEVIPEWVPAHLSGEVLRYQEARPKDIDPHGREGAVMILISRTKLPIKIIAPYLKTIYTFLLRGKLEGDVCWPTTKKESYLQANQSAPVNLVGWEERFINMTRDIREQLGAPSIHTD